MFRSMFKEGDYTHINVTVNAMLYYIDVSEVPAKVREVR